jgi:cysteinyl-tRNA synthetase
LSGIPATQDNVEYVRQQVALKRSQLKTKYGHMSRVYNERNNVNSQTNEPVVPKHKTEKILREVSRVLNDKDEATENPFIGLKKLFSEQAGVSTEELEKEITPKELKQFKKLLKSEEGRKLQEYLDSVLTDEKLAKLGIDPELYNPELVDQELLRQHVQENTQTNGQVNLKDVDQLRYAIEQELKQKPELAAVIKEMGGDVEQLLAKREKDIKEGKFAQFVQREDYGDIVYKLNRDRLKKLGRDPDEKLHKK